MQTHAYNRLPGKTLPGLSVTTSIQILVGLERVFDAPLTCPIKSTGDTYMQGALKKQVGGRRGHANAPKGVRVTRRDGKLRALLLFRRIQDPSRPVPFSPARSRLQRA